MDSYARVRGVLLVAVCTVLLQSTDALLCSRNDIFVQGARQVVKRPGCSIFDATSRLHQNGYDSLLSTLTGTLSLVDMMLGYASLGDEGLKSLAEELKTNTTMTKVFLHLNDVKDKGVTEIAMALSNNDYVNELSLHTNDIGGPGALAIANLLTNKPNSGLERLHLGDNHIGEIGGEYLGNALKVNRHLKHLYLFKDSIGLNNTKSASQAMVNGEFTSGIVSNFYVIGNNINDKGVVFVADALKVNNVLTHLDLGKNVIKLRGAELLSDALKVNTGLKTLSLGFNQIDNNGAVHLGNMLAVNSDLVCLDLNGNWINWQGAQYIATALNASNTALKYIDLSSNYIPDSALLMLTYYFENTNLEKYYLTTFPDGDYVCDKLKYCGIEDEDMYNLCQQKGLLP